MYQKYQTDAVVLAGWETGEADKVYALYTRDFGLVRARAMAVRREASKMRYALQNFSLANVSLIKGKRAWRIGGTRVIFTAPQEVRALSAMARIAELSLKLVTGEEKNEYLYEALAGAHEALRKGSPSEEIEILCVARILYSLGYISNEALKSALFAHAEYSVADTERTTELRDKLLASINNAIAESQLVRR